MAGQWQKIKKTLKTEREDPEEKKVNIRCGTTLWGSFLTRRKRNTFLQRDRKIIETMLSIIRGKAPNGGKEPACEGEAAQSRKGVRKKKKKKIPEKRILLGKINRGRNGSFESRKGILKDGPGGGAWEAQIRSVTTGDILSSRRGKKKRTARQQSFRKGSVAKGERPIFKKWEEVKGQLQTMGRETRTTVDATRTFIMAHTAERDRHGGEKKRQSRKGG